MSLGIVIVGSKSFGATVAKQLDQGHWIIGVCAPPGDPDDRLRQLAEERKWQLLQLNEEDFEEAKPDLIVSAHNFRWIPDEVIATAKKGAIGYHPSLLPRHRGNDAVTWTIQHGDPIAGGTVYWLDGGWDTGTILLQDWCHVLPGWTASDLWKEALFPMGVELLDKAVRLIHDGRAPYTGTTQDERAATHGPPADAN